jgi:myo-inositol 2-dehydrogenase/D-chiro-inositol 1-dehydrogenase
MTPPLRIGLFGTGRIGLVHAANAATLPGTVLHRICDPALERARETAQQHGVPHVTADPEEMLSAGDLDAVVVASPTPTHVGLIEECIDRGLPVLCEKPIHLDIRRVDELREKARAARTPVAIGFNRRFDPSIADLHRTVREGGVGRLEQLTIVSRDPEPPGAEYIAASGGIFRDMTIHDFDIARLFVPGIVEVTARATQSFSPEIAAAGDFDTATTVLRGAGGEIVMIVNSRHCAYGYDQRLEAFGDAGAARVENLLPLTTRSFGAGGVEGTTPYYSSFVDRYAEAYRAELAEFAEGVRSGTVRNPGFEDGRAALLLADAAQESAERGVAVAVEPSA